MTSAAPLLALALAAGPYPAPRVVQPTPATKCDRVTVVVADAAKGEIKGTTAAGAVTYRAGPDVQLVDRDGKPAGAASSLAQGTKVRIYYVLEDGARIQEIDLE